MKINVTPEMVAKMTPDKLIKKIEYYLEKGEFELARGYIQGYRKIPGFKAEEMEFLILKAEKGEESGKKMKTKKSKKNDDKKKEMI